jgi:hypothetical protein
VLPENKQFKTPVGSENEKWTKMSSFPWTLHFVMVKCDVLFEVWTEYLNIIYTSVKQAFRQIQM